jgi:hypothetical protein
MHSLATSFVAAAHQTSPAYLEYGRSSRARQALKAVDAYFQDSTCLIADMPSSQQVLTQVSFLGKLLECIR